MLKWPINFYFVLSLTRNVSYFIEEIPKDFLATSTTFIQYYRIRNKLDKTDVESKEVKSEFKSEED